MEADEAGTATVLRGEHDVRLAGTQEKWRLSRETNLLETVNIRGSSVG